MKRKIILLGIIIFLGILGIIMAFQYSEKIEKKSFQIQYQAENEEMKTFELTDEALVKELNQYIKEIKQIPEEEVGEIGEYNISCVIQINQDTTIDFDKDRPSRAFLHRDENTYLINGDNELFQKIILHVEGKENDLNQICQYEKIYEIINVIDSNDQNYQFITIKDQEKKEIVTIKTEKTLQDFQEGQFYLFQMDGPKASFSLEDFFEKSTIKQATISTLDHPNTMKCPEN